MIQMSPQTRIMVAIEPINFQKRMDGTAGICRALFERDPFDGVIYVFRNRRATMIRLYFFDGLVEWCCDLRIAKGKFPHWPEDRQPLTGIKAHELILLIKGANPTTTKVLPEWKKMG